jgi:hypothetical protein
MGSQRWDGHQQAQAKHFGGEPWSIVVSRHRFSPNHENLATTHLTRPSSGELCEGAACGCVQGGHSQTRGSDRKEWDSNLSPRYFSKSSVPLPSTADLC